jgi:hypothetical protein
MQHLILPWSNAQVPGISAEIVTDETHSTDPIIMIPDHAVAEVRAIFAAFCASWQQGDTHACDLLHPLFTKHGVTPAVRC